MKTRQFKSTVGGAGQVARSVVDYMIEIYKKGYYPFIDAISPESPLYGDSVGEFAMPEVLQYYLIREFTKILTVGNIIQVKPGRKKRKKTELGFIDACEEQINYYKKRLFLFSPERVELSCDRLSHYTGCDVDNFQEHVLITNYDMHLKIFKKLFPKAVGSKGECQMPSLHAKKPGKEGISIVNIGVGPANAKTFTDQMAVLRPSCFIMIGHCGGLMMTQKIGDYVLADNFIRDDHVLAVVLPREIPISSTLVINNVLLSEIQKSKMPFHIGTIFTTNNRDWEYKISHYRERFAQSRASAIDMESSVICAQGFRYKIPHASLLMISDKPLHGKLKLAKDSRKFYQTSKEKHVKIAVKAIQSLDNKERTHLDLSGLVSYPELQLDSVMW